MTDNKPKPAWIVGFIEAEGSLSYWDCDGTKYPHFCMAQKNKKILEKIINILDLDTKVYECGNCYQISFKGEEKILKMIEFLDGRLHTQYAKKRLAKWKKIYKKAYPDFDSTKTFLMDCDFSTSFKETDDDGT